MKKLFAAFIVLILFQFSNAQSSYFTISGKVLDAETKLPMQGASVFAENTTLGTTTGRDGTFALAVTQWRI
ncbi:MAG: carboxypeptidase-like regulatory domain-containing protein [Ferruginibacter sp.]